MRKFSLLSLVYIEKFYLTSLAEGTLYLQDIKINDSQDWD